MSDRDERLAALLTRLEDDRHGGRLGDDLENLVAGKRRGGLPDRPHRTDDLPHVGPADQPGTASCGPVLKYDQRMLVHPQGFVDKPVAGAGQGQVPVQGDECGEPLKDARLEPDRRRAGGCHTYIVGICR